MTIARSGSGRVLFLADRLPPRPDGAARALGAVVKHFPAPGCRVCTPLRRGAGPADRTMGRAVWRVRTFVGPQGLGLRAWNAQVRWRTARRTPAVVVACGVGPEAEIALTLHRERGTPIVLRLETEDLVELRAAVQGGSEDAAAARALLAAAVAIVVPTRSAWLEAYKLQARPHELEVIAPGLDLERFRPGPADPAVVRRLGKAKGPLVLAASDQDPAADPETVLRAFSAVRSQLRQATLVVLGMGATPPAALLRNLRIDRAVRFLDAGTVPTPELYRAVDLFLTAHRTGADAEAQGTELPLLEAMASGVPVVATRTPATAELVEDEETGVLVEPGAHAKLAHAALDVLRVAAKRDRLVEQAREHVVERHDAARTAAELLAFLDVVLVRRLRCEAPAPPPGETVHTAA